jgi:hypothetical protein
MTITLSDITFSNEADVVPLSGQEQIVNHFSANTLAGDDIITGTADDSTSIGIYNWDGYTSGVIPSINTGEGDDIITGTTGCNLDGFGIFNWGSINTEEDNDQIIGSGKIGIYNYGETRYNNYRREGRIDTGEGDDIIMGISTYNNDTPYSAAIDNRGVISTGNGNDSIIAYGNFSNLRNVSLGDGDDSIIVTGDTYNEGDISTGNGNDFIITYGRFDSPSYGGFVNLEEGNDYFYGFGDNYFSGGNGEEDTLELPSGSYTVGISPAGGNFAKDGIIMNTVGFEKLIAGSTSYDFTSLTEGQTIIVA